MYVLKEIRDRQNISDIIWTFREASRAVLFDEDNLVPLLYVSKFHYHKLPGGGVDDGESIEQAVKRECLEEVGVEIDIQGDVGKIIEFRSQHKLKQVSYCFYGKVVSKNKPNFTQQELDQGFEIVWMPLEEAISQMANDEPQNYEGTFIQERDLEFLKKTEQIMKEGK